MIKKIKQYIHKINKPSLTIVESGLFSKLTLSKSHTKIHFIYHSFIFI